MSESTNFNPNLKLYMDPHVDYMTRYFHERQVMPECNGMPDRPVDRVERAMCMHWAKNQYGGYEIAIDQKNDPNSPNGKIFVCKLCGCEIDPSFTEHAIETLSECKKVLNSFAAFAPTQGIKPDAYQALIDTKVSIAQLMTLMSQFNAFIKKENTSSNAETNLVASYETPDQFGSITGLV